MSSQEPSGELTATPLFPTWLFCKDPPELYSFNDTIERFAQKVRKIDPIGRKISNSKGWQSRDDLHLNPTMSPLIDLIIQTMKEIQVFLSVADHLDFKVGSCWINVNENGAKNSPHIHGNSHFSGVYYVKVSEGSGDIEFKDPNSISRQIYNFAYQNENLRNCHEVRYSAAVGRLLIFPSYLTHEVHETHGEGKRISASFNIVAT